METILWVVVVVAIYGFICSEVDYWDRRATMKFNDYCLPPKPILAYWLSPLLLLLGFITVGLILLGAEVYFWKTSWVCRNLLLTAVLISLGITCIFPGLMPYSAMVLAGLLIWFILAKFVDWQVDAFSVIRKASLIILLALDMLVIGLGVWLYQGGYSQGVVPLGAILICFLWGTFKVGVDVVESDLSL